MIFRKIKEEIKTWTEAESKLAPSVSPTVTAEAGCRKRSRSQKPETKTIFELETEIKFGCKKKIMPEMVSLRSKS